MRLKRLTVAGFRGFNLERTLEFHDKLTVIAAPNSHGKTSISEALEFLIYGATSKVEKADSKEEYKDSYRNRHFPGSESAYIEGTFALSGGNEQRLRIEIAPDGISTRRLVDGQAVATWPFHATLHTAARPFVLQHALKYLLLVPPAERFQGFARLLGLNEVDSTFQALIGLCTKPAAGLPTEVQRVLSDLSSLEARMSAVPELKKAMSLLKRGSEKESDAFALIQERADTLIGGKVNPEQRVARLSEARTAAAAKVYSGDVVLHHYNPSQATQLASAKKTLSTVVSATFLDDYGRLSIHGTAARLQKEASLLNIGAELISATPDSCPLCKQALTDDLRRSIQDRHAAAKAQIEQGVAREHSRPRVTRAVADVKAALKEHQELSEVRAQHLIATLQPENAAKVAELLGGASTASAEIVRANAGVASGLRERLNRAAATVAGAIVTCESEVKYDRETLAAAEALGKALQEYLRAAEEFTAQTAQMESHLAGPGAVFRQALDSLAGTAELSLLSDLLEKHTTIARALRVRDVLEGLKELKKHVEQTLAEMMDTSMSTDLTAAVMKWYAKIRTGGDPDVHFSGFTMDRTKGGEFKSRRLSVKAKSYGVELASAVSSLSESKLNALGLCVSIASAVRSPGPWGFLIIDDPIQSWDEDHEMQFIDVIRGLVESEGRQVVVLSHKGGWAKQVCQGCRALNGVHYEMTGYTKDGPSIAAMEWSPIEQRLREAETIANDPTATSVKLQQGEEEIRLAACQAASVVAKQKLGRTTSAHNMNSKDVRAILVEAALPTDLVDRISAVLVKADAAHHAPKSYQPNASRIRQALGLIREVLKWVDKA